MRPASSAVGDFGEPRHGLRPIVDRLLQRRRDRRRIGRTREVARYHHEPPIAAVLERSQFHFGITLFPVEVLFQSLPAVDVVVLPGRQRRRVFRHALAVARLEHEGQRVGQLHRLELGVAGVLEGVGVGTVRQHLVVQAHAAGHEALGLGVIDAINQPHELGHDVAVIPRRPEGVLRHRPALREDHEVDVGGARRVRRRGHHRVDRRIGMVVEQRADRREAPQVVFVGIVVAVPGDHVERRMRHLGAIKLAAPFDDQRAGLFAVLVGRDRRVEIARVGEAVGADRPAVRQRQRAAVVLAHVGARRSVDQFAAEDHAAGNDADFAGLDLDDAELGAEAQLVLLRHDQHLAIGIEEVLALHRLGDQQHVRRHAGLRLGIARRGDGVHAGDEGEPLLRDRRRTPAQLPDRQFGVVALGRGADRAPVDLLEAGGVPDRRANAVKPGPLVGRLRRRERRAGNLLGIEAVAHLLRRVPPDRQRTRQRLRFEGVAEPGHVFERRHAYSLEHV